MSRLESARKLTITHVVVPGLFGGIESVLQLLMPGLQKRGHRVHLVAVLDRDDPAHPFVRRLREAGVETSIVVAPGRAYRREHRAIRGVLAEIRPDVVHTHGYRADLIAAHAARREGFKTVTTVHGFAGGDWKNRLYEALQRRGFRRMDAVVAVSRQQLPVLESAGLSRRVFLVPNAWAPPGSARSRDESRRRFGLDDSTRVIGFVGRLSREKGAHILLEALSRVDDPTVCVSVVGDGPERTALEQQAGELGVAERVRFHGAVPDAWRYFTAFDVFVLPSLTEGTPISLFEAIHAAVPVVASEVGGVPDVLPAAHPGLVPPGSAGVLAEAIRATIGNAEVARAAVDTSRQQLIVYAPGPWVQHYEEIYAQL